MSSTRPSAAIEPWRPVALRRLLPVFALWLCLFLPARAQQYAVGTNLADYAAGGTFNLEGSWGPARHWTLGAGLKYNPFGHKQRQVSASARWWPWHIYSGWWLAGRVLAQEYRNAPPSGESREGDRLGAGFSGGYARMLTPRFNLDLGAGLWVGRDRYVTYACPRCGRRTGQGIETFFLPGEINVSISYIF